LKPSNLLFSPSGCLKLGDFGLARVHLESARSDPNYSHEVATRWYRSVELLFGSRSYGFGVDVWACGAVLGELLRGGEPLFPGANDIDQLYRVLAIRGSPTEQNWPGHADKALLPDFGKIAFPHMQPVPLRTLVHTDAPDEAVDLLERMLQLDPKQRISAADALKHPFLSTDEQQSAHAAATASTAADSNSTAGVQSTVNGPALISRRQLLEAEDEELLRELATLPAVVKAWQQQQQQQQTTPKKDSTSSANGATANAELQRMHLSGSEWAPLDSASFRRALHQLPAPLKLGSTQGTISSVMSSSGTALLPHLPPVRMEDICAL